MAFCDCTGLTSITIPDSVTSIGNSAFSGCTGLTSVTIGNSVTSIGYSAFYGCTGLTSITIPNSVTSIGYVAFYGCTGLTSITIPNSVTLIDEKSFCGCTGLTSVTIPNSVTSIGIEAFYHCTGLKSVTIGNSVTSIGSYAFCGCTGLTSITLPNSVTSIGYYAFFNCGGLKNVIYFGTEEQKNKIYIGSNNNSLIRFTWTYHTEHCYDNDCDTTCNVCDYVRTITHTYSNDCDTTCNVCGYVRTITHSYKSAWSNNSTNHWHECSICGVTKDTANHIYDNDCDTTCDVCGYTRTVSHDYVNGKCTLCGGYDPNVVVNSGEFTSGAKWYVNSSTNSLYIYGNGETDKYKTSASAPWYANRSIITKVYVEPTVTKLGNLSFDCLYNLQNVYFDTKDITFGYYIFPEKSNLTIYGVSGGTIEAYANNNGITFSKYTNTNTPISPIVLSAENRNITVQAVSGYEYSIDGINFQDSNIFTNVDGDKILTVCQRIKETDKYKCSATSTKTKVIFITAPKIKLKGATKIEVDTISGYEYSLDEIEWQSTAVFNKLIPEEEYTLYVRLKNSSSVTVVNLAKSGVNFTTGEFDSISDIPLTAQRMTFLINSLLNTTNEMASDVNGDKKIDILDLVALKKQIANI